MRSPVSVRLIDVRMNSLLAMTPPLPNQLLSNRRYALN